MEKRQNPQTKKERMIRVLRNIGIIFAVGIGYLIFLTLTGKGIPCVFHVVSGLYCPGCGISRMFVCLARMDIRGALSQNALVMVMLPFFLWFGGRRMYFYIQRGKSELYGVEKSIENVLVILAFIITIIFTVLRNNPSFAILAPH